MQLRLFFLLLIGWLSLGLGLSSCHFSNPEDLAQQHADQNKDMIQVYDYQGYLVDLKAPASRIVCLFEASLDDLYMLGAGKQVIAIPSKIYTSQELYSAYSILDTRIKNKQLATPSGWEASTNIESVIALQPDLVIVNASQSDLIQILRRMQISVYPVRSENLDQTRQELLDLGQLTGTSARAKHMVHFINNEIQAISLRHKQDNQVKHIYYAWSGGRIFSSSGLDSIPNTIMQLAGTQNVVSSRIDQPNINPEKLIEWNPDVILLWNTDPSLVYSRPELSSLKAIKQKQVFNLSPSFLFNPHTPKLLLAANQLNHWVYPDPKKLQAADEDQLRILSEFYGRELALPLLQLKQP